MELQTEKKFAYWLLCILFIVGIICYAAFPVPKSEEPIRILLKSTAGNVLFDHKVHTSEDGYGYECVDCHHTLEDESETPESCGECHEPDAEEMKKSDVLHSQCIGCHDQHGTGPDKCDGCHIPL